MKLELKLKTKFIKQIWKKSNKIENKIQTELVLKLKTKFIKRNSNEIGNKIHQPKLKTKFKWNWS
jgi:hypothetical protein